MNEKEVIDMKEIESRQQSFTKKDVAMAIAGAAIAVGGLVYAVKEEMAIKDRCMEAGQIDVNRNKTPIYDPKTECRILFFEDENGKPKPIDVIGIRW